ncbi:MAG: hypothetical protein ACKVXR_01665 [Planctomycetota bacterium]
MDRDRNVRGSSAAFGFLTAIGVGLAVLLRAIEAQRKSLWLDELHSLWTAGGESVAQVIERVRVDFHPPVYFLLLHAVDDWDPHSQRWISIAFSLATLVPLLAIARSAGLSPQARLVVLGLFATSPYQILYAAELRAYAALGFCATTMAWAAFTDRAPAKWRFLGFAAALGIGLNVHYFAGIAALCFLAAQPLIRGGQGAGALPWRKLALAFALGLFLFLPWLLTKERWLLSDPGKLWRPEVMRLKSPKPEIATESRLRPADLLKAATMPLRTHVPMISTLGRPVSGPAQLAAVSFFALALAGVGFLLFGLARGRSPPGGRKLWAVIAAGGLTYLACIVLCLSLWKGFPAQYFTIGAWVLPLLGAALVDSIAWPRVRSIFAGALVLASLASGSCHVLGQSRENMRGAVGTAIELGRPVGAIYTAVLWQPTWYPHALPFEFYAPEVERFEPTQVPPAGDGEKRPVVVITRHVSLSGKMGMPEEWKSIRKGRRVTKTVWIDQSIGVVVFEPE